MSKINSFIDYAADILADTDNGISTASVLEICNKFAVEYNVNIPYSRLYKFSNPFPNKRTALKENLYKFREEQVFHIIEYICDLNYCKDDLEFKKVKMKLYNNFPQYVEQNDNEDLNFDILENKNLLESFPDASKSYNDAVCLYNLGQFERNLIDSLRLTLELIVKQVLCNNKSLENNIIEVCGYLKGKECSQEFINMFQKLIDYYTKYNNDKIKHNHNIKAIEVDFIFGITNLFIKLIVK